MREKQGDCTRDTGGKVEQSIMKKDFAFGAGELAHGNDKHFVIIRFNIRIKFNC